ncbi:redoxin family protein [Olivibacter sp. CPCC 100613]|uniref:TlpA family protein disulfide reductase n=1 Tax=Olivibacter sp. CPCC 100613 TaxID=3079931 RepID=UPI002FF52404
MNKQFKNLTIRSVIFIMAAISFAACGNTDKNKQNKATDEATAPEKSTEAETEETPDMLFKNKDGQVISLKSLKGKVVFINFWATWCPPCIQEMPSINKLKQTFKGNDNIEFIMVDVDNKIEQSTAFMEENKYDLPVYTPASNIPPDYLGEAIPTTVVLDKNGDMVGRMEGGRDYSDEGIIKGLTELLEK